MLAPLLATEDPYAAASIFSQAGWKVEYESARDGDQPRACLSLAHSRIELVLPKRSLRRPAWPRHRIPHPCISTRAERAGLCCTARPASCSARCVSGDLVSAGSGRRSSATASPSWVATRTRIWRWSPPIQGSWRSRMVCVSGMARIA